MKILIIEDSTEVVEAISLCFQIRWPEVSISTAVEGITGIKAFKSEPFDMVILDLNLPDMDGLEVLKQIRSSSRVPLIIVTVRGEENDRTKGLEMGADDYIVKPFSYRELIARANAVFRRTHEVSNTPPLIVRGKLTLNLHTDEALLGDQTIKLAPTETKLLYILMQSAEKSLESKKLLQEAWGKEHTDSDLLRTYIRRLRGKLGDIPPRIILTEHGEGYRFVSPK